MEIDSNYSSSSQISSAQSEQKAFREADFLAIMLTEITHQDPMEPTETSEMVENMQKLQDLANSTYDKFRDDIRWAQDLIGSEVTVQQVNLTEAESQALIERGLRPDTGFETKAGVIETYRLQGESVWVTVNGNDYPIDNIQQIIPTTEGSEYAASIANTMLGRQVTWYDAGLQQVQTGMVTDLEWEQDDITLKVDGDRQVPFDEITGIGLNRVSDENTG